jgi:hypothetical protein
MGHFKRTRKTGNATMMFSMCGDYLRPGIWDAVMREFPIPKAGYDSILI